MNESKLEKYSEEKAQEEASQLQEMIESGEAVSYSHAEQKLEREKIQKELSEMPPLFNEQEYFRMDSDGLLKKDYEAFKMSFQETGFIDSGFGKIKPATGNYERFSRTRGLKQIDARTADDIYDFAEKVAFESVYFENQREIAKQALSKAFDAIDNTNITDQKSGRRYGGYHMCSCNVARDLGELANKLGFPDLANRFSRVYCPESPEYDNYEPVNLSQIEWGPHISSVDYPVEIIKKNILSNIKDRIELLRREQK